MKFFPIGRYRLLLGTLSLASLLIRTGAHAGDLPVGTASGSTTVEGATVEMKFAAAFVDQKEEGNPVILILSDTKVSVEKWPSQDDMAREKKEWNGAVLSLDPKTGKLNYSTLFVNENINAVSGYWQLTLDHPGGKDLVGKVTSTDPDSKEYRFDVQFHAALK